MSLGCLYYCILHTLQITSIWKQTEHSVHGNKMQRVHLVFSMSYDNCQTMHVVINNKNMWQCCMYAIICGNNINPEILLSNPHPAGLASMHRNERGFMLAEIHHKKSCLWPNTPRYGDNWIYIFPVIYGIWEKLATFSLLHLVTSASFSPWCKRLDRRLDRRLAIQKGWIESWRAGWIEGWIAG